MKRDQLVRELLALPDLDVEILSNNGDSTRDVMQVTVERVVRGIALPTPHRYDIIVLSAGGEGCDEVYD